MPITERTLPLLERLTLPLKLASLLLDVLGALLTIPFRAAATADRHVQNAVLRALTRKLSVAQLQFLRGTTADTFVKWKATRLDEPLSSEAIAEDAALHWIGRSDAEKVLLLIHGMRAFRSLFALRPLTRTQAAGISCHSPSLTSR
jgi:hypothetical protein